MRDLPYDGDDFAAYPPYPEEPEHQGGYLPEISHDRADATGDPAESIPGAEDWTGGDQEGWPIYGAPVLSADPAPGSVPSAGHATGPGRVRRPGRSARRLALYAAVIVPALAAGVGIALVKVTGDATANVALSGNRADAVPSVGLSTTSPTGTNASPSATEGGASTTPASTRPPASTNLGVQVGTGESGPATLAGILAAADSSVEGKGLLPPAKCDDYRQNATGAIVCTSPVPGVAEIFYQNYSSLPALYSAYKAEVTELDGGTFRQDTGTCGNGAKSYVEFGWNQEEGHPHNFTVAQMAAGRVGQVFAAGRMACFATHTAHGVSQDIVWTIDGGPALGVAIGNGSPTAVYQLWGALHHAVLFRGTEMCGTAPRMNLHDIPTGNLKVLPVCPAGVQAVPDPPQA